jgi:hypothetical protein
MRYTVTVEVEGLETQEDAVEAVQAMLDHGKADHGYACDELEADGDEPDRSVAEADYTARTPDPKPSPRVYVEGGCVQDVSNLDGCECVELFDQDEADVDAEYTGVYWWPDGSVSAKVEVGSRTPKQ